MRVSGGSVLFLWANVMDHLVSGKLNVVLCRLWWFCVLIGGLFNMDLGCIGLIWGAGAECLDRGRGGGLGSVQGVWMTLFRI